MDGISNAPDREALAREAEERARIARFVYSAHRGEVDALLIELDRAMRKHGPILSGHDGWSKIREELDELWKHVTTNGDEGYSDSARREALQVAAVALRYCIDLSRT